LSSNGFFVTLMPMWATRLPSLERIARSLREPRPHGLARRHVHDHARLAALELGHAGRVFRDRCEDQLGQRRLAAAVLRKARQRDALPRHLRVEPIGARADGVLRDVLAMLGEGGRAHREALVVGQVLQEGAEGLLQDDAHGLRVGRVDAVDGLEIAPVGQGLLGVEDAIEARLHRGGVEGRPVVELTRRSSA
jgi:hypothetical protein